jgi:hypothetical protein
MVFLGQPTNTVGAPAYTWANNTNTGVYLPAASTLGIVTAGADRIRVLSNGNVGIGTTAPQTTLHVQGNTRINGYLSIPALPAFSAYYPSTTSGTIKFISETLSHAAFNKSSGVFTCPVAGIYAFHFDGFKESNGNNCECLFRFNGTPTGARNYTSGTSYCALSLSLVIYMTVNQTIDVYISVGNLHSNMAGALCGHMIG